MKTITKEGATVVTIINAFIESAKRQQELEAGAEPIPRISAFGAAREGFLFDAERPVLEIQFTEPFAEGPEGTYQREAVAAALTGPKGEEKTRIDNPVFGAKSVKMGFPNIWAATAALNRVFQLYTLL